MLFSIIIPCRNEGDHLRRTVRSMIQARGSEQEIIVVDDGSTDGCCDFLRSGEMPGVRLVEGKNLGVAGARNVGAAQARGEILCFCDAHLELPPGWLAALARPLGEGMAEVVCPAMADFRRPHAVGYGVTWGASLQWRWLHRRPPEPSYVPLAPGGCLLVSRQVYEAVGGFERGFYGFGFDDQEFSLKVWLFGYRVMVQPQVQVRHLFREAHPYPVGADELLHNFLRMTFLHFNRRRLKRVMEMVRGQPGFAGVMAGLLDSDVWEKRMNYFRRRRYDDDWFMERFKIPF
ncbi:glycosyltransferase family 2 protein [Desulfofundulus salinus]|uniref:glycosyltransferase family 2 protein n=1 Tax=Desulfofundulus salinus TaxID=2419843 RepID=UPI0014032D5D|nr:glycosyltransferase [Desulfofundulus salinum]